MRLNNKQIEIIKNVILQKCGEGEIYLFGSRIDDEKLGGDIDLYVIPKDNINKLKKKIEAKILLEDKLQIPVDIVCSYNETRKIEKIAKTGIKLI